jgi:hypothetical protein
VFQYVVEHACLTVEKWSLAVPAAVRGLLHLLAAVGSLFVVRCIYKSNYNNCLSTAAVAVVVTLQPSHAMTVRAVVLAVIYFM